MIAIIKTQYAYSASLWPVSLWQLWRNPWEIRSDHHVSLERQAHLCQLCLVFPEIPLEESLQINSDTKKLVFFPFLKALALLLPYYTPKHIQAGFKTQTVISEFISVESEQHADIFQRPDTCFLWLMNYKWCLIEDL